LLGARIVVLLKEISELPLLPTNRRKATGGATKLEVEYEIALIEYMLEVARGFYNNTISLKGRTNRQQPCWLSFGGGYTGKQSMLCD
jgi:hypothetical protein